MDLINDLQAYAESQVADYGIPAVSLATWHNGRLQQAAAGILNTETGVEATPDSIFQIGSITKVMTACLVMQLVDEGRVDLDHLVRDYLRDFQLVDETVAQQLTVRQLLNHTSGIAGDFFPDDNDHQGNLIARHVDRCHLLPIVHPVGKLFSYSNSAYAIAGRLVEVVRGMSWYQAMKEFIYRPLGMGHAIADPIDVIRHRAAIGHVHNQGDPDNLIVSRRPYLSLGQAPCGATPTMSATDLITFARAHLDYGVSQAGNRWLSEQSVKAMQSPGFDLPPVSQIASESLGLGWFLSHYKKQDVSTFSHGGATLGFLAMLQVLPGQNTAYAILLNGYKPAALRAITRDLLQALGGVDSKEPPVTDGSRDPALFHAVSGVYESMDCVIEVRHEGERLTAKKTFKVDPLPPQILLLRWIDDYRFAAFTEDGDRAPNLVFLEPDDGGVPRYLFSAKRLNERV